MSSKIDTTLAEAVWLARHAERIDFANRAWPQSAERPFDPHLSEKGQLQAQKLAQRLAAEDIGHIFASPFLRTLQTAWPVAEALDMPIKIEYGLSEWLNPQWFSALPSYLAAADRPKLFARVDSDYRSVLQPSHPETWPEFEARAAKTVQALVAGYDGQILLIGHGATLTGATQGLIAGKPKINTPLCGLVLAARNQADWSLTLNGDVAHLQDNQNLHQGVWA